MAVRCVIGLGNPGPEYDWTPHNLGWMLAQRMAEKNRFHWKKERLYLWTDTMPIYLLPQTFMNLSGDAALAAMSRFRLNPEEMLVCTDDFDLPLGQIRLRARGSAGTHRGLKSIIEKCGTSEFPRLRLGFGPLPEHVSVSDFVLKTYPKAQRDQVDLALGWAEKALECALEEGVERAMNQFNGKTTA